MATQTELVPNSHPLPAPPAETGMVALIERMIVRPDVDVEKLERLIAVQERLNLAAAEQVFNAAMSNAQREMSAVAANKWNGQTKSNYATYAAIDKMLRPVYSKHGFALSFNTETVKADEIRILCYVSHAGGFTRTYHIDMPADGKGAKGGDVMTRTHAAGSATTYGMRYLLKMIFNVAVGDKDEADDDGNGAGAQERTAAQPPPGLEALLSELESAAVAGGKSWALAWNKSPQEMRTFIVRHHRARYEQMKNVAAEADKR